MKLLTVALLVQVVHRYDFKPMGANDKPVKLMALHAEELLLHPVPIVVRESSLLVHPSGDYAYMINGTESALDYSPTKPL